LPDDAALAEHGVRYEQDGAIGTITLDRPERLNAQTPSMWRALAGLGRTLSGDVRVVVLRGAGRAFSAGLDIAMFSPDGLPGEPTFADLATMAEDAADSTIAQFQEAFTWWGRPDVVSIAAVQGHAVGAGFQLALGCDLRIVADDVQLSIAEVTRGIVPDLGGTGALVDLVGYQRALELCVTGRRVRAPEAVQLGIALLAVPPGELDQAARDLATAIVAAPRAAVIETKSLLRNAAHRSRHERLAAERAAQLRRLRDLAGAGE
jgi:enoyl-CoA hydratase/carnithine racemase